MIFGCDYYPEHWPEERWQTAWDRLLADAGGVFRDYDRERTDAIGQKY